MWPRILYFFRILGCGRNYKQSLGAAERQVVVLRSFEVSGEYKSIKINEFAPLHFMKSERKGVVTKDIIILGSNSRTCDQFKVSCNSVIKLLNFSSPVSQISKDLTNSPLIMMVT